MSYGGSRRGKIQSLTRAFNIAAAELEAQGKDVLRLHIGAPSTGAPKAAIQALEKVAQHDILGYSAAVGITALRERIAKHYQEQYQVAVDPKRVVVTVGASGALSLALLSWFDSSEKIGLPYPVYGAYKNVIELNGLNFVGIPTSFENRFLPTVADLKNLDQKLDGIILISPSNPAGSILKPEELKALIDYCKKNHIKVISDEIYHGIIYDKNVEQMTAQAFSNEVISINSFSKYYSMPGWRIGWMVVPEALLDSMGCVMRSMLIAPPTPSQYVALAAMDCRAELDEHLIRYKKNRDILLNELHAAGFDKFIDPQAAFYLYIHVAHLHKDSIKFCKRMLDEIYITTSPGTDFDPRHGHHYIRISYAGSTENIVAAVKRLKAWRK